MVFSYVRRCFPVELRFQDVFLARRNEDSMICESCKKNNASVHMIDVVNNSKQELHLCEDCAQSKGVTIKSHMQKGSSDKGIAEGLPEIFQSLSGSQGAAGVETCSQPNRPCPESKGAPGQTAGVAPNSPERAEVGGRSRRRSDTRRC